MKTTVVFRVMSVVAGFTILFGSCENVFTYSPLVALQRDAANLAPEQQVALAEEAINSGNEEAMSELLDALSESEDPTVLPVAADLALTLSGGPEIATALTTTALSLDPEDPAAVEAALASFSETLEAQVDVEKIDQAVSLIDKTVAAGGTPTSEQYLLAAVSLSVKVAKEADSASLLIGGEEEPPDFTPDQEEDLSKAVEFLEASGLSSEELPFAVPSP